VAFGADVGGSGGRDILLIKLAPDQVEDVDASIDEGSVRPERPRVGDGLTLGMSLTNTGGATHTFVAQVSLWRPGNSSGDPDQSFDRDVILRPGEQAAVSWTYAVDEEGNWAYQFAVLGAGPLQGESPLCQWPSAAASFLVSDEGEGELKGLVILATVSNVRRAPNLDSEIITTLRKGSPVEVVSHPANGDWVDGYRWWHVKVGILRGWIAGADSLTSYISEYDFVGEHIEVLDDVKVTAYNIALEEELRGKKTGNSAQDASPGGLSGAFYKEFLYSAYGVCMQGSGRALGGQTIAYRSGGGGWVDKDGVPTPPSDWSVRPPFWIRDEAEVRFTELPEGVYKGSYGTALPWYTIAVDRAVLPIGSIVYIPALAGKAVGKETLSGYFLAADTGGAIRGKRVDIFVGAGSRAMDGWVNFTGAVEFDAATSWPVRAASLKSPGELRVYDGDGRIAGVVDGQVVDDIPDAAYDRARNEIVVVFPQEPLRYVVVGTAIGEYSLSIECAEEGRSTTFSARAIPTAEGAVHQYTIGWDALRRGEDGVAVTVDENGDGNYEQSLGAGSELNGRRFPISAVSSPTKRGQCQCQWLYPLVGTALAGSIIVGIVLASRQRRSRS
jgi:3D (Asp-Asp-Asp) domain-containing protein